MLPAPIKDTNSSLVLPDPICQRFTLAEIRYATYNFDEALVIGRGGFGKVYKCPRKIGSANKVAVKRLHSMSNQGPHQFEAEVKVLSKLRHGNLVSLVGYCNEGNELVLAYEFMPNGTLKGHLCKPDSALSWLQRLKICVGAARGLDYLHTGTSTQEGVIHRDVKTSNILLDANFAAKISDFGLAKVGPIDQTRTYVSTDVRGTFGYMDPCYFYSGKLTRKSDVYAFGVVLFEVLTGRQAVDSTLDEDQWGLAPWAQDQIKLGNLNQIIDSRITGQISRKCLKEFASIACQCLSTQPKQRPTMAEVVVKLECILSQEKESANHVVDERRFMYKVRSFFTGKLDMTPDGAVASKPVVMDGAGGSKLDVSADGIQESRNPSLRAFTYPELESATNGFKHLGPSPGLNESIYKGWVDERTYAPTKPGVGLAMYVRKKYIGTSKVHSVYCNLQLLEEFNHPNLIKLLGYCLYALDLFCVYELISDTSLAEYLHGGPGITSLSWVARLKIALGAAQGLSFFHLKKKHPAYKKVKSDFILVDTDFNARLSDFEVEDSFMDSCSYFPEIDASSRYHTDKLDGLIELPPDEGFGVKSEIYAFGVILLEILTGKVYDRRGPLRKQKLVKWATPLLADEVNLGMIMDPQIQYNYPTKGAFQLARLVSSCLEPTQDKRPSMEEILQVLYQLYQEEIKSV